MKSTKNDHLCAFEAFFRPVYRDTTWIEALGFRTQNWQQLDKSLENHERFSCHPKSQIFFLLPASSTRMITLLKQNVTPYSFICVGLFSENFRRYYLCDDTLK